MPRSAIFILFFLMQSLVTASLTHSRTASSSILRVPEDYPTIQAAIDAATSGDTIQVTEGTYYENIEIWKSNLCILGENRGTTIIDGHGNGNVLWIDGENVSLANFELRNGVDGILITSSYNVTIQNVTVTGNEAGIAIHESASVFMRNNAMYNNAHGNLDIGGGTSIEHYIHDIDTSNRVNGKQVYYLMNQHDLVIDEISFPDVGYLGIVNSTRVIVRGLDFGQDCQGVLFAYTSNSTVTNTTVRERGTGIHLSHSIDNEISDNILIDGGDGVKIENYANNNTISGNWILGNSMGIRIVDSNSNAIVDNMLISNVYYGIVFHFGFKACGNIFVGNTIANSQHGLDAGGDNNTFYHNNFVDNNVQVDWGHPNVWDNGFEGNYWSDYNGTDGDGDGIGDDPYVINAENRDNCPLMRQHPPLYGDLNEDNTIDIYDIIIIATAFGTQPPQPQWNPKADMNKDSIIDIYDLITIAARFGTQGYNYIP